MISLIYSAFLGTASCTPGRRRAAPCLFSILACTIVFFSSPAFGDSEVVQEEEAVSESGEGISIPVPEGQDVMGIRIPHHNMNGELVMLITAEVARRVEDGEIEMERMKIDLWDEARAHSWLAMPKSRFNMGTRILSGNDGALIDRDEFTIEGENLEFDLASQKGIMRGKVTMTIKQADQLTQ